MQKYLILVFILFNGLIQYATASEFILCNQNLENFGTFEAFRERTGRDFQAYQLKREALVKRFKVADCNLIAIQELLGRTEKEAEEGIQLFLQELSRETGKNFSGIIGKTNDTWIRNGILYNTDFFTLLQFISYAPYALPKLSRYSRTGMFSRGPLKAEFRIKKSTEQLTFITFHFKSRMRGQFDPQRLQWEGSRSEMAEALRNIVEQNVDEKSLFFLAGDRNSTPEATSAEILRGELTLNQFQKEDGCQIGSTGLPVCQFLSRKIPLLFSVFYGDSDLKEINGTHFYKGKGRWIDDILTHAKTAVFAQARSALPGDFESNVLFDPPEASDHALLSLVVRDY